MSNKYDEWIQKYIQAKGNMNFHKKMEGCLIEVAAQHPLLKGGFPNEEFQKRLDLAVELYKEKKNVGMEVKIYVPGSIHMEDGKADEISLSQAGCNYLVTKKIPAADLFGEDKNKQYKGRNGVYNSSDECYVASKLYEEYSFKELHCVCSSAQLMRKALSYIRFGYVPDMHSVSCDVMYHNYIDEIFKYIPIILEDDNALQGKSEEADRLRTLRNPDL